MSDEPTEPVDDDVEDDDEEDDPKLISEKHLNFKPGQPPPRFGRRR